MIKAMHEFAAQYPRYGYRRIKKRPRRRAAYGRPRPLPASGANRVWAYDFVFDACANGKQLKCLTVIDEYTRECLAIDVARPHSFKPRDRGADEDRQDSIVKVTNELIYVYVSHESP